MFRRARVCVSYLMLAAGIAALAIHPRVDAAPAPQSIQTLTGSGVPGPPVTPVGPGQMRMGLARVNAFLDADREHLSYMPGEVLVKFRPNVTVGGQTRALSALRSRPDAGALRWIGDIAVLTDDTEPDAGVLARELSSQPEVAYAQPNYIRRLPARVSTQYPGAGRLAERGGASRRALVELHAERP